MNIFFEGNEYDDYEDGDRKINYLRYAAIAAVVFVALFLFFAVRSISLSAKLGDANDQIAAYEQLQKENEELKMNNLALTEELEGLKNAQAEEAVQEEEKAEEEEAASNVNTYTVVAGDTFGAISTKVYGNFSGYKKIMEANGITDEGSLQIGQQLIIP